MPSIPVCHTSECISEIETCCLVCTCIFLYSPDITSTHGHLQIAESEGPKRLLTLLDFVVFLMVCGREQPVPGRSSERTLHARFRY